MLAADELPAGHPSQFVLVDDKAQIRGYYSNGEPSEMPILKRDIRELARQIK